MKIISLAVIIAFFVTGCVGGGPVITKTKTFNGTTSFANPYGNLCFTKEIGHNTMCMKDDKRFTTIEEFQNLWGEPKSRGMKDGKEYLTYNVDLAWRGMVFFAIIPIPVLFPVGRNEVSLVFENDKLIQFNREYGEGNYAICGLHSEGPNGFGCVIWH